MPDDKPFIKASKDILGEHGVYRMFAVGRMKDANAFRNYCRSLGLDMIEYNEVAKDLDGYANAPKWASIIEESKKFLGTIESVSPSPCSFVMLNDDIRKEIGIMRIGDELCACIDGYTADVWKFLKNDFLIVSVWNIIRATFEEIGQSIPTIAELKELLDDKVWDLYEKGLTATLNQVDTGNSTRQIMIYKPKSISEMSAFVAAIRPGFSSLVDTFLNRKYYSTGVREIDRLLESSSHFMLYQESIMTVLSYCGIPEDGTYDIIKKIAKLFWRFQ